MHPHHASTSDAKPSPRTGKKLQKKGSVPESDDESEKRRTSGRLNNEGRLPARREGNWDHQRKNPKGSNGRRKSRAHNRHPYEPWRGKAQLLIKSSRFGKEEIWGGAAHSTEQRILVLRRSGTEITGTINEKKEGAIRSVRGERETSRWGKKIVKIATCGWLQMDHPFIG